MGECRGMLEEPQGGQGECSRGRSQKKLVQEQGGHCRLFVRSWNLILSEVEVTGGF